MIKCRTPYNELHQVQGEINDMPSMTIPDQTMTVSEIMERYARGLPLGGERVPVYYGEEEEFPDMEKLDLSEKYDLIRNNAQHIEELMEKLSNQQPVEKPIESAPAVPAAQSTPQGGANGAVGVPSGANPS